MYVCVHMTEQAANENIKTQPGGFANCSVEGVGLPPCVVGLGPVLHHNWHVNSIVCICVDKSVSVC